MNEELKVRSFRLSEEVFEKIKHLSEDFDNQNAAMESLIAAYEVQSAKAVLTDRQTDIADYDAHLQAIQSAFLHSLEINENAEKRIRSEFQNLLSSKDEMIIMLQTQLEASRAESATAALTVQEVTERAECDSQAAEEQIAEYIKRAENAESEKYAAIRSSESAEAARKELLDILHDTKEQLSMSRTEAVRAIESEKQYADKVKELTEQLAEQQRRAERAETELEKQKVMAEMAAERAEVAKQQAILEERAKQSDKIQELYSEINELRKELHPVQISKRKDDGRTNF